MLLDVLPLELLEHVLSFLDVAPPSTERLHHEPIIGLFKSEFPPLKNLSLTSRFMRRLIVKSLFRHVNIRVNDPLAELCKILRKHSIAAYCIESVLLQDAASDVSDDNDWEREYYLDRTVSNIFNIFDPAAITCALSPGDLAGLMSTARSFNDVDAFQVPFQVLRLEQPPPKREIEGTYSQKRRTIFCFRPWTCMTYNEGSSVPAYSGYEYFHLSMPGLFRMHSPFPESLNVRTFTYVAMFPFGSLGNLFDGLSKLPLKELRFRFCVHPDRKNELDIGRADNRDLWMELESSFSSIATCLGAGNWTTAERLVLLDAEDQNLDDILARLFTAETMNGWTSKGNGVWEKPSVPTNAQLQ